MAAVNPIPLPAELRRLSIRQARWGQFVLAAIVLLAGIYGLSEYWRPVMVFGSDATFQDFDQLLGERKEIEGVVNGARVRVEGVARVSRREIDILVGDGTEPFTIYMRIPSWPKGIVGRRLIVEGRLSRQWYTGVHESRPGFYRLTGRSTGFGYYLEDCTYEPVADQQAATSAE